MSIVVRIWLWPSSSMTTRGWTPSASSSVAAVCRPSCSRTSRTPASRRRVFQARQSDLRSIGRPLAWLKDQVVVFPERAGGDAFLALGGPVGAQRLDEWDRERQGA